MRRGLVIVLLLIAALSGFALAQETTPNPAPPTDTPTLTPTASETPTTTLLPPPPTETPIPSPTLPSTETETATPTATADFPTPEATVEETPPVEATLEVTAELTAEATETAAETPTLTPTASETPLPPEPEWVLVSSADFEQGAPPQEWRFDPGWMSQFIDGSHVFGPRSFGGNALLVTPPMLDTAVQMRVWLGNGIAAMSMRQSEAGGYTATFEESGFLRLYRGRDELGQVFLGPIAGQWRTLRLSAAGDVVRVSLDGAELIAVVDPAPLPAGRVTLGGRRSIGSHFLVDDVTMWAAAGEWTPPPARAAAFAVPMAFGDESNSIVGRISTSLAYTFFRFENNEFQNTLTIVNPDGTTADHDELVTSGPNAWSPDGKWLLTYNPDMSSIRVFNPGTETEITLTSLPVLYDGTGDSCPVWSPDSSSVAFLSTGRDGVETTGGYTYPRTAIYVVQAGGQSEPEQVALAPDGVNYGCPQWQPAAAGGQITVNAINRTTGDIQYSVHSQPRNHHTL